MLSIARTSVLRYQLQKPLLVVSAIPARLSPNRGTGNFTLAPQNRHVASSVSGRPGSQTLPHAAQNVKEEAGNSAADLAKAIAGGTLNVGDVASKATDSFLGITGKVASSVPKSAMVFGLAGTLPYVGTTAFTLYAARQAGLAASGLYTAMQPAASLALLHTCMEWQITYGAVMLSFLGALHWGMEFAEYGGRKGYARLTVGTLPVIYAWSTLLLDPSMALIAQWIGFTGLWAADMQATAVGWTPKWYSQYRFYLTLLIGSCIVFTLGGSNFLGPVAGHSFSTKKLEDLRAERSRLRRGNEEEIESDIEAVTSEDSEAYVVVRKKHENGESKDK